MIGIILVMLFIFKSSGYPSPDVTIKPNGELVFDYKPIKDYTGEFDYGFEMPMLSLRLYTGSVEPYYTPKERSINNKKLAELYQISINKDTHQVFLGKSGVLPQRTPVRIKLMIGGEPQISWICLRDGKLISQNNGWLGWIGAESDEHFAERCQNL